MGYDRRRGKGDISTDLMLTELNDILDVQYMNEYNLSTYFCHAI